MRSFACAILLACLAAALAPAGLAAEPVRFNPDTDPSRIRWTDLPRDFGPSPDVRGQRFGIILKTPSNEYWRLMAAGYRQRAETSGAKLDVQAAQSEDDPLRQLALMQTMIGNRYKALLISPISSLNLQPAIEDAIAAEIPVVDVDGAVVDNVTQFVGPVNFEMGVRVADWFVEHYPSGGKVAVIEGQPGVFSTVQRSAGFRAKLGETGRFEVVAHPSGQWDRQKAFDETLAVLRAHPDLVGIYCNNDTMALGAVDAVKSLDRLGQVKVIGSDGTGVAYESIQAGELTGTIAIFPFLIGQIGLDVAERLSVGQAIPRVIETPQVLVTRDNIDLYTGDEASLRQALARD